MVGRGGGNSQKKMASGCYDAAVAQEESAEKAPCPEREALMYQITAVVREMFALHTEQLEAVLHGDPEGEERLQSRLRDVRERRILLIDRLRSHVANHGCR